MTTSAGHVSADVAAGPVRLVVGCGYLGERVALGWLAEAKDAGEAWPRFVHALLAANEFHFID